MAGDRVRAVRGAVLGWLGDDWHRFHSYVRAGDPVLTVTARTAATG